MEDARAVLLAVEVVRADVGEVVVREGVVEGADEEVERLARTLLLHGPKRRHVRLGGVEEGRQRRRVRRLRLVRRLERAEQLLVLVHRLQAVRLDARVDRAFGPLVGESLREPRELWYLHVLHRRRVARAWRRGRGS